ncbi:packaged DNA stabilization protein [uncultured Paraglaciecola sp.]|uniref:packaged DNA stabilization protein n=1 Tax=uncultured Paraglaciecola sp. TaxID=1765024 RepID=UPI00262E1611|nr:packaged DNA stabilization protein [uncultured Paraglaciecola sp.]
MRQPIPLPNGIVGLDDFPELKESLVNLFRVESGLLKAPGITGFSTGNGACRGAVTFQDEAYMVSVGSFAKIASDGTFSNLSGGTVSGTANCRFAQDYSVLVIQVAGGNAYVYDGTNFGQITDGDYVSSNEVVAINGRFVFVPTDGGPCFYTDVNGMTYAARASCIPATNFFDAELLPDKNIGAIVVKNDLYILGQETTELFRDTGDTVATFRRVDQGAVHTGYIAGKAHYRGTFAFLGRDREGMPDFFIMQPGRAEPISNPAIKEILSGYTEAQLSAVTSMRYEWKDKEVIEWRLSDITLAYCAGNWIYRRSGVNDNYRANHMTRAYDTYIVGDATTTQIGKLADVNTEYTAPVERVIETFVRGEKGSHFVADSIELDCLTGTGVTEGTISLQVSRDSQEFHQPVWRSLGRHGNRDQRVIWQGGIGQFESHMGLRLRTTSDVNFNTKAIHFTGSY